MNLSRHFNRLMASVVSVSLAASPLAGVGMAHAQNAPAAEAPGDAGWQKEFEAWRSASKGGKAADYEMYLKTYPAGKFASVAKKRMDELSGAKPADTAKVDTQQTADTAQADTTAARSTEAGEDEATKQRDLEMWRQVSKTGKQADYEKYLKTFPKGKFAKVAKTRVDAMIAAANAPADQQVAVTKQAPVQQDDQNQAQADDQNQANDNNAQVTEQATPDDQADQQQQADDQTNVQEKSQDNQAQAPASDWEQEYALWKAASDGNTVKEYEAYLKAYPNGKFAAIAQARIVQLAAAEQPASTIDEGDDSQAEQNNKVKPNQQADDQNQQAADQNQQADDQSQQPDDQNQQAQDQNQTDQGQNDQNQMADNQTDDQSQQNDMGQNTQNKQQSQYSQGTPDTEDQFLNREGRHEIQGRLTSLGYDTGGSDGAFGPNSRTAISMWQQDNGAPVSGYLSGDQIAQIRIQSQVSYAQWLNSRVVVQRPVIVRPRREKVIIEERHPGVDAAIAAGVLGAVVLGGHRFKNRPGPGRVKVIGRFKMNNFFGGCRKKRRC